MREPGRSADRSVPIFLALLAACLIVGVGYVAFAALRSHADVSVAATVRPPTPSPAHASPTPGGSGPATPGVGTPAPSATPIASEPVSVLFQNVARDDGYGKVASVSYTQPDGPRTISGLTCERVYWAAGEGLCLVPEFGIVSTYYALIFGADFEPRARITLDGAPSRARVSSDGRYGATTVFVFGHSYADAEFSTRTTIIDMAAGTNVVDDLERFTVTRDGQVLSSPDFNFWGVTFAADSDVFYATLRTGGRTYLGRGSVSGRAVELIHENVECPSLSPDGTRIAYKWRSSDLIPSWRLHVLDIATMQETPLAETASIDDQVEWLDNDNVVYANGSDLWTVPADGTGTPRLYLTNGLSPAVIRS